MSLNIASEMLTRILLLLLQFYQDVSLRTPFGKAVDITELGADLTTALQAAFTLLSEPHRACPPP